MKFTDTILSIPPYISTPWKNIVSLRVEGSVLIIELITGSKVAIPNLDPSDIERVFTAHAKVHEIKKGVLPFPGIEMLGAVWQHTPEQANSPDLPPEIVEKIASMTKTMGLENPALLPKAEPHCNCPYCQIMRALSSGEDSASEESVSEEDLRFRTWDIKQEAEKLYTVSNPFDNKEHYNVFLGEPLGCTCGEKNCEHLQAVLKS